MKSKLLQKLNCEYVDEIFTVVGVIFIVGMLLYIGSLNDRIHELYADQKVQMQKMTEVLERRSNTIRRLEETVDVMQTTLSEQNKALQLISEKNCSYHTKDKQ